MTETSIIKNHQSKHAVIRCANYKFHMVMHNITLLKYQNNSQYFLQNFAAEAVWFTWRNRNLKYFTFLYNLNTKIFTPFPPHCNLMLMCDILMSFAIL